MVLVDTTTRLPFAIAYSAAGSRYASDLPTPVPASMMMRLPSLIAFATAFAICACSLRSSKPSSASDSAPSSDSSAPTRSASILLMRSLARSGATSERSLSPIWRMSSPFTPTAPCGGVGAAASRRRGLAAMPSSR